VRNRDAPERSLAPELSADLDGAAAVGADGRCIPLDIRGLEAAEALEVRCLARQRVRREPRRGENDDDGRDEDEDESPAST